MMKRTSWKADRERGPERRASKRDNAEIQEESRRKLPGSWILEKFCSPSTTKKSPSRSMARKNVYKKERYTFGSCSTKQSRGVFLTPDSSPAWPRNISDWKARLLARRDSSLCQTKNWPVENQAEAEEKHEHGIPEPSKKHSVQKRKLG